MRCRLSSLARFSPLSVSAAWKVWRVRGVWRVAVRAVLALARESRLSPLEIFMIVSSALGFTTPRPPPPPRSVL